MATPLAPRACVAVEPTNSCSGFPKIGTGPNSDVCRPTPHLMKDSALRNVSEELATCQLRLAVDGIGREAGRSDTLT